MKISLESKVRIVFIFTFILLCFALFFIDKNQQFKNQKTIIHHYSTLAKYIHRHRLPPPMLIEYLNENDFIETSNPRDVINDIDAILFKERGVEILTKNKELYLHILTPRFNILFKDKKNKLESSYLHFIIFAIISFMLFFIYYLIMKNIKESELLLSSRQLFLRTVMHELKTPIAKGRIVSELVNDEKQQTRLINIFDKLNFLINDFAKVEEIVSKNYQTNFHDIHLSLIIKNSIEMLMLDNTDNIEIKNIHDMKIKVDLELFSMALKNLLDNGLKYSTDKKVIIEEKENTLCITSKGKPLSYPLEKYFKPFHNDTTDKNHGMGLGLYIVHSILSIHSMDFSYNYKNHQNIFTIHF